MRILSLVIGFLLILSLSYSAFTTDLHFEKYNEFNSIYYNFEVTSSSGETYLVCTPQLIYKSDDINTYTYSYTPFTLNLSNNELSYTETIDIPSEANNVKISDLSRFQIICNSDISTTYGIDDEVVVLPVYVFLFEILIFALLLYVLGYNQAYYVFLSLFTSAVLFGYYSTGILLFEVGVSFGVGIIILFEKYILGE